MPAEIPTYDANSEEPQSSWQQERKALSEAINSGELSQELMARIIQVFETTTGIKFSIFFAAQSEIFPEASEADIAFDLLEAGLAVTESNQSFEEIVELGAHAIGEDIGPTFFDN